MCVCRFIWFSIGKMHRGLRYDAAESVEEFEILQNLRKTFIFSSNAYVRLLGRQDVTRQENVLRHSIIITFCILYTSQILIIYNMFLKISKILEFNHVFTKCSNCIVKR